MKLSNIEYPVYKLDQFENIDIQDKIVWGDGYLIDDLNVKEETLGLRRLKSPLKHKKAKLRKHCINLASMVRRGSGQYIDRLGRIFTYKKKKFEKVVYHKIKSLGIKNNKTIAYLEGIKTPFILNHIPDPGYKWIGILYKGAIPWIVWEYSREKLPNKRVKI